jgi:xanthosine utilization system XapX-like protein
MGFNPALDYPYLGVIFSRRSVQVPPATQLVGIIGQMIARPVVPWAVDQRFFGAGKKQSGRKYSVLHRAALTGL